MFKVDLMCDIYTSKPVGILILAFNWSTVRFSLASKTGDEDPRPVLGKKKVPYQYDGYLGHKMYLQICNLISLHVFNLRDNATNFIIIIIWPQLNKERITKRHQTWWF